MFTDVFDENGVCVLDKDQQDTAEMEKEWALIKSSRQKLTLLDAIELTHKCSEDTQLEECLLADARRPISYVAKRLGITRRQAIIFSVFFAKYEDSRIDMGDIRRHLNMTAIQALRLKEDVSAIEQKGLIISNDHNSRDSWFVPGCVVESICNNRKPKNRLNTKLTAEDLFEQINIMCFRRSDDAISFDSYCNDINNLCSTNNQLKFCQQLNKYQLEKQDMALLVWACTMLVSRDEYICRSDLANMHDMKLKCKSQFKSLLTGKSPLITKGLLERVNNGEFQDREIWQLTEKTRRELLSDLDFINVVDPYQGLINPDSIKSKDLFYNPETRNQLDRIIKLLDDKNFKEVTSRLENSVLNTGLTVLLSGPAGTGKSEFVYQVAKMTGRHIMSVKISDLLNSFVGESERNVSKMLERYASLVKSCPICPILFLDEIDSVISKRFKDVSRSVDKMNNNIQSIFLEALSNFHGILIGTTNLTDNMADEAIERRFLMKVRVDKPSASVRKNIWHSMLPELSDSLLETISSEFDLTGGKVLNVAKKVVMYKAIEGVDADETTIVGFCEEESAGYGKTNIIGY